MMTVVLLFAAIAAGCAVLSWLADRKPCAHANLIRLDEFESLCSDCDAFVPTEVEQ